MRLVNVKWIIKKNTAKAEFNLLKEGMCVQCMHIGPFDNEPLTLKKMETYITENGYIHDITETRHHHEIYLSDPRKGDINKMRTVLRIQYDLNNKEYRLNYNVISSRT